MQSRGIPMAGALAALMLLSPACSVKEERGGCPVYVTVLTERFIQNGLSDGVVSFHATGPIDQENINFLSYIGKGFLQACPRDYARAAVLSGLVHERINETSLYVPYGQPAGLIWSYGETFSAREDEYRIEAVPHKQYCQVRFLFDERPTAPPDYAWRFRLKASCNGLNIYTMEPLEGAYCCPVGPDALGEWYGVIPRQKHNDLLLEVFLPEDGSETEGRTDYVIDLGQRFEEMGYDWTRTDLADVTVKVGFTSAGICLDVLEWTDDDAYRNIEI
ncbi:MAG: hypothetical protein K6E35_02810 [Bacteroidales bacterium]|nr:hypothetical protein [Bacteroidales bacterium]